MVEALQSPAEATYGFISGQVLFLYLHLSGVACFVLIIARRIAPLVHAQRDVRFDRPLTRARAVLQFWLGQWKQPRYFGAGLLHILIFAGFVLLFVRAVSMLIMGSDPSFIMPGLSGTAGHVYDIVKDYASTIVFICVVIAGVRRVVVQRYAVPTKFGRARTGDAIFLLSMIALLMVADSLFDASRAAFYQEQGEAAEYLAPLTLAWAIKGTMLSVSLPVLQNIHLGSYALHSVAFFLLLCYRPFGSGIQFHVITSLFSVYFAKLDHGTVKPVRWGVSDEHLDQVKSFGVKKFEDFTWKHMLDFYSCADCGRCSNLCPANAAGRPLSPRFFTRKARDYSFQHFPVFGRAHNNAALVGTVYSEDEIWSCTTCGTCEEECPLLIEYIDKVVDLRRGLVDDGNVPRSIQKPLKAIESRGNPYGKMEKKRAEWAKSCGVTVLNGNNGADTLYFVDSITSYDDRMQAIARATVSILERAGVKFGILGPGEKDSGHDVRRFGEDMLFQALKEHNTEAIRSTGVQRIVTADPHAYNALKHDYNDVPPVEHISEFMVRELRSGNLHLTEAADRANVYTYHDPCYLGRHNRVYDAPREVLDTIPGLKRVEMGRCRDRSFCCGGGGLMLFYEPVEEQRMGVLRVRMAAEAGAKVIVTACPFCLVNIEDAIKVAGLEGKMTAIDLTELAEQHFAPNNSNATAVQTEQVIGR